MCPDCGEPIAIATQAEVPDPNVSDKDWATTLIICFFAGGLGIHSFYVGKITIGIIQLLTMGGCGVWSLIDFILIICKKYNDSEGRPIVK